MAKAAPALLGFVVVGGLAAGRGGYFPPAWGWSALGLLWVAAIALATVSAFSISRLEVLWLAALAALSGWIAVSILWSGTPETVLEVERALVYIAGPLAVLLIVRRRTMPHLLGGMLAAIVLVSAYSLATRLLPDRLGVFDPVASYRLSQPIGYWNALGIFAAIGSLLALGFAGRARTLPVRALAAAAPVLLVPTLYFTFGRGPWIAFAAGIAATIALDPRRLQLTIVLLTLAPAPALAVWLGAHSHALTRNQDDLAAAAHDGHRLALVIGALAVFTVGLRLGLAYAERRIRVGTTLRRAYALALLVVLAATLALIFGRYGSPATIARNSYEAFKAPPVGVSAPGSNLNKRLLSFSGNGRYDFWETAWRDREAHPLLGSGAGTFERYWLRHRPLEGQVRDAHSLYFETLAELGPSGLALLLAVLALPLVAAVRARWHPLVPSAFGAYVGYVVHAGVDWDWEITAVTLTGLFCGAAALVAARKQDEGRAIRPSVRTGALVVTLALAGCAFVGLRGNLAIAASETAAGKGEWGRSAAEAREALRWAPWSADARRLLAQSQLVLGNAKAARVTLSEALARDSENWRLWADLADASSGRARRRALDVAIRLNPRNSNLVAARARR